MILNSLYKKTRPNVCSYRKRKSIVQGIRGNTTLFMSQKKTKKETEIFCWSVDKTSN